MKTHIQGLPHLSRQIVREGEDRRRRSFHVCHFFQDGLIHLCEDLLRKLHTLRLTAFLLWIWKEIVFGSLLESTATQALGLAKERSRLSVCAGGARCCLQMMILNHVEVFFEETPELANVITRIMNMLDISLTVGDHNQLKQLKLFFSRTTGQVPGEYTKECKRNPGKFCCPLAAERAKAKCKTQLTRSLHLQALFVEPFAALCEKSTVLSLLVSLQSSGKNAQAFACKLSSPFHKCPVHSSQLSSQLV